MNDERKNAVTEPPFTGKYNDHKEKGTYACASCGKELFSSLAKYDSGSGWPSFMDVCDSDHVTLVEDHSHNMHRVEVLCSGCSSHLGHVFDDGPGKSKKRWCINSYSLDFIPE